MSRNRDHYGDRVQPILLLSIRADDAAADNEYESFQTLAGLGERDLRRIRLDQQPLGDIDLRDWSGIWVGGGPFNYTDPDETKSPIQRRVEADLRGLLDVVVRDRLPVPGRLLRRRGARQPPGRGRSTGATPSRSAPSGSPSPRRAGVTRCCGSCPPSSTRSPGTRRRSASCPVTPSCWPARPTCPVQAFRVGSNVYATQFHPELDAAGMCTRIDVYKHAGYFDPSEADELKALAWRSDVSTRPRSCARSSGATGGTGWGPRPVGGRASGRAPRAGSRRPAHRPGERRSGWPNGSPGCRCSRSCWRACGWRSAGWSTSGGPSGSRDGGLISASRR